MIESKRYLPQIKESLEQIEVTLNWQNLEKSYIRTRISFALRSAIICLRGCRGSKQATDIDSSCSAIVREGRLDS